MAKVSAPSEELLAEATRVARRLAARDDNARAAVDDLAHDVLVRAIENPPPDGNMGPWMERIGRNLCVDRWRAASRQQLAPGDVEATVAPPTSEDRALAHERHRRVRRALISLPRPQRRAVILRYHAGWSFEQIAARLGVMTATARTRVFRGLALLRRQLGALRTMVAPGSFAFKPVIVALVVATVDPSVVQVAVRVVPQVIEGDSHSVGRTRGARGDRRPLALALSPLRAARGPEADPVSLSRVRERAGERESLARSAREGSPLRFDFEDDHITSELVRPDGEPIIGDLPAAHPSLIELRTQFVPEMLKSLEDL